VNGRKSPFLPKKRVLRYNRRNMSALNAPEKGPSLASSPEAQRKLAVFQPGRIVELNALLVTLGSVQRISDGSGSWTGGQQNGTTDEKTLSPRAHAIAALPVQAAMQKQLQEHIEQEIKELSKSAKRIAKLNRPGGAYKLNELYKRIRLLNGLIASIVEASYDVVKRLFIRVFIDKQPVS